MSQLHDLRGQSRCFDFTFEEQEGHPSLYGQWSTAMLALVYSGNLSYMLMSACSQCKCEHAHAEFHVPQFWDLAGNNVTLDANCVPLQVGTRCQHCSYQF